MPTTTYAITNAAIRYAGQWNIGQLSASLQGYWQWSGQHGQFEFKATGTDCTMSLAYITSAPTMSVSVDGGAFTNLTLGSVNTLSDVTLFTGLSDAQHTVIVRHGTGTQSNIGVHISTAIKVTGAAPALASPDNYGNQYNAADYPFARYTLYLGGCKTLQGSGGYYNQVSMQYPDCSIKFRANPTSIRIWTLGAGQKYRVAQDGVLLGAAATSVAGDSRYQWVTVASGLDGAEHEYEIIACTQTDFQLVHVMLVGGDVVATKPSDKYVLLGVGDSYIEPQGTGDSTTGILRPLAVATNRHVLNQGLSSSRAVHFAGFAVLSVEQRIGENYNWGYPRADLVDVVIYEIGNNDFRNSVASADFEAAATKEIRALMAAYPTAHIYVMGPVVGTEAQYSAANRALHATAAQNVVTAINDADVTYVSWDALLSAPYNFNVTAGQDTTDGIHPTVAGSAKCVSYLETLIADAANVSEGGGAVNPFNGLIMAR